MAFQAWNVFGTFEKRRTLVAPTVPSITPSTSVPSCSHNKDSLYFFSFIVVSPEFSGFVFCFYIFNFCLFFGLFVFLIVFLLFERVALFFSKAQSVVQLSLWFVRARAGLVVKLLSKQGNRYVTIWVCGIRVSFHEFYRNQTTAELCRTGSMGCW